MTMHLLMMRTVFTTGAPTASSTTSRRAPNWTSPMPHTSVPTFLPIPPKQPHANAVKWLGRYLKGTREKGMILKPTGTSFDVYMDSNFAGNWKHSKAKS